MEHGIREGPNEVHVMRDENQRALVLLERTDKCVDGTDVEVGCRLIHEQEIRRVEKQFHERKPCFFPAAKHCYRLEDVVSAEQESSKQGAGHLLGNARGCGFHSRLQYRGVCTEHFVSVLREITRAHLVAELAITLLSFQYPG